MRLCSRCSTHSTDWEQPAASGGDTCAISTHHPQARQGALAIRRTGLPHARVHRTAGTGPSSQGVSFQGKQLFLSL